MWLSRGTVLPAVFTRFRDETTETPSETGRHSREGLTGEHAHRQACRSRIRTYRVIYRLNEEDNTLDVIFVGPRRDVYEELRSYLLSRAQTNN